MEVLVLDSFREPWLYLGYFPGEQTRVGGLPRMIYGSESKA
jgi:hypothetical protein